MGEANPHSRQEECSWTPQETANCVSKRAIGQEQPYTLNQGWNSSQVVQIRERLGIQQIANEKTHLSCIGSIFKALLEQLKEPLILMLLFSAGISLLLGNLADAMSIAIALLIVSLVAAVQEYRSEQALEKLQNLVPATCSTIRDGKVVDHMLASKLVIGDLIVLSTGDRVPADCRVVESVEIAVDESALTGETHAVHKTHDQVQLGSSSPGLTEQANVVFAGTLVTAGRGKAIVLALGSDTEFGKVAAELSEIEERKSPLQIKIDELSQRLATFSTGAIVVIAVIGWLLGRDFLETLTVAVSLAVAAIPEGLPICVTVTLALGVLRMAKSNAIVKKLPVVESLGCATVIASDKTGTLTQNEMTVRTIFTLAQPKTKYGFTGVGYGLKSGSLVFHSKENLIDCPKVPIDSPDHRPSVDALLYAASLCNNAVQLADSTLSGQPTEMALLVATNKAGLQDPRPQYQRVHEVPFSSERKRMEVRVRAVSGAHVCDLFQRADKSPDRSLLVVKGMPETILGECRYYFRGNSVCTLDEVSKRVTMEEARHMASKGLRVLAVAYGDHQDDLIFAGILGMEDPPREGVTESVRCLRSGGVKCIMITGDSMETAMAIAHRCGIVGPIHGSMDEYSHHSSTSGLDPLMGSSNSSGDDSIELEMMNASQAMSGADIDDTAVDLLSERISGVKVFYRVSPRHKLLIVRALQKNGEVVTMTGDGVNDAVALKGADIGVSMGLKGTDVAKEASDVVLADDNFSTITMAISEGKGIFFNIRCFLAFQLSTSFAALAMDCMATALNLPTPLNAMQILWINIIMDGPPAQSLGVEPVDERILNAKPRKADDPIITRALLLRAISSAALIVFVTLTTFANELHDGLVSRRDTTMTFMTFVNCDLFNAYVCRSADAFFYELDFFGNPTFLWAVGGSIFGQLLVIYWKPLQEVFQTEALPVSDLFFIILMSSSVLVLDTIRKRFFRETFTNGINSNPRTRRGRRISAWRTCRSSRGRSKAKSGRSV